MYHVRSLAAQNAMDVACVATVKNTFLEFGLRRPQLRRARTAPCPGDQLDLASTTDGDSEVEEFSLPSRSTTPCWADEMDEDACRSATSELSSSSRALSSEQARHGLSSQTAFEPAQQLADAFSVEHQACNATSEFSCISSTDSGPLSTETCAEKDYAWTALSKAASVPHCAPRPRRSGSHRAEAKFRFTCRFDVGIAEDVDFRVVRRLIGPEAENMKAMVKKSGGSKIRIHGKGASKDCSHASDEPLHIVVGATTAGRLDRAAALVTALLLRVHAEYEAYCSDAGLQKPSLKISPVDGVALPPDVRAPNKN